MSCRHRQQQMGMVLVVGLIILLVMTLIGLSAARSTLLEERMSGHNTDGGVAFQLAEAALRAGEESVQQPMLPDFNGTGGRYQATEYSDPRLPPRWKQWQNGNEAAQWRDNAITYHGTTEAPAPVNQAGAHYYLEAFPRVYGPGESLAADMPADEVGFYRITARGVGISGTTSVILQSTYKR